jgi:uncharacterized membrane protein (UPF0136 family)
MLANLRALFSVIVDIVLLRRGPEQLPASPVLLAAVVGVYLVISSLVAASVSVQDRNWPVELLIGTATMLIWYQVALRLAKKRERFPQTMTAMFGVSTIFAPLLVPLLNSVQTQILAKQQPSQFTAMLALFLMVWLVVIFVRIVRSAFEWPWPAALLLVIGQEIFSVVVFVLVFGTPGDAS